MSVLWKLLTGYLRKPKKEVKPELESLESLYNAIVESELSADSNDVTETVADPDIYNIKGDVCQTRCGTVTSILSDNGLIDNQLYFDLRDVTHNIKVGMKVKYLAYRRRETDDWRVRKIISVVDEEWDVDEIDRSNDEKMREANTRVIIGQVTKRENRNVTLNSEISFSLDEVKADFTPVEGDWVQLDVLVEVDGNSADLMGEILVVDRLRPLRWRLFSGLVTQWTKTYGSIDKSIFFTRDVCESGYRPQLRDSVAVQAIESDQGPFTWRALIVVPLVQQDPGSVCTERSREIQTLLENKYGIIITNKLDFGVVNYGKTKEIVAEVSNTGQMKQFFKFSKFHGSLKSSQMTLLSPCPNGDIVLHPHDKINFRFSCTGSNLGKSSELYVFTFKGFKIGRYLEVEVQDPNYNSLLSTGSSNGYLWKGCSARNNPKLGRLTNTGMVVAGVRPIKPPAFVAKRLGMYSMPERLWEAVAVFQELEEVIGKIQNVVPSLKLNLSINNFPDRFHALLFLEEIEQCLRMQNYDIKSTKFIVKGEFLGLDVPGLAEKRPSLLIGDKVIATPIGGGDSDVQYEGFVHKVFAKSILLKFNASFHNAYADGDYSVRFYQSRTPMRRCHMAVDTAIQNLGEKVLFPNGLGLKQPQVVIEQDGAEVTIQSSPLMRPQKLKWFNPHLNQKQKEAICNVLKGEARPLPYIIFGPPGTGKTVTLVETILQILFTIPHSRLMVATPSNSSANLIAERLLDSGTLLPGDLVRLVGYHCIEEGTVPPRLIPYTTSGDIRLNRQEHVHYGKLKVSSNAKTLERHRVIVGTCISLGLLHTMGVTKDCFTHVVVDEAGQATEPEILIPLGYVPTDTGQIILAGDPLQLGPVVSSLIAGHFGLGQSFLSRLLDRFPYQRDPKGFTEENVVYNPYVVTRLVMNYRSLPEILHLSSSLFYDNELEPQVNVESSMEGELLTKLAPILPRRDNGSVPAVIFHGIRGTNMQDNSPSWFNPQEVVQILYYVRKLYNHGVSADDVGIITPYQRQVQKIRGLLETLNIPIPKIGSVEEFQGQERLVIILSAVRSSSAMVPSDVQHALGFVSSPQRLNVAITRARALLIVLGNPHLLYLDPCWRSVIDYCVKRHTYTGCNLPTAAEVEAMISSFNMNIFP